MIQSKKSQEQVALPKAEESKLMKPVTNPALKQLNQKYLGKISKGEINVGLLNKSKSKQTPEQIYDHQIKAKKLSKAAKQKEELQKKLQYVNKSIQSIKQYDFASASRVNNEQSPRSSSLSSPNQFVQKNKEFHQRVKEEKRKLQQKKQHQRQRKEDKQKEAENQKAKRQSEEKAKKKQQIYENMKKIKQRMEDRQEDIKKREAQYLKNIAKTTLFKKLQQKYAQQQANLLQERKKKLANIRNLHKPVSLSEIQQHQRKFLQVLKQKQSLRERERILSNATDQYKVSYKSPKHRMFYSDKTKEGTQQSKVKAEKVRQFSEHVRENFSPQIDQSKRQSLQELLQQERERQRKKQAKIEEDKERVQEIKSKGLRYLQEVKELPKKRNGNSSSLSQASERKAYKNYLTHTQRGSSNKWGSILGSSAQKREKAIKLQMQAQRIQQSLKLRQQKVRVLKGNHDEVDQQYFEMIKAKLDLLQI